jgi:IS605 OrfB family transposase
MRRKNKQNFQYIPFWNLLQKVKYKAEAVGIEVVFTEEAYTCFLKPMKIMSP